MSIATVKRATVGVPGTPADLIARLSEHIEQGDIPADATILEVEVDYEYDLGLTYRRAWSSLTITLEWTA